MQPTRKNTREEIIQASVEIIRKQGIEFLSARNLGKKLNASPATIFTHFDTMEEVQEASISEVRKIYDQYVLRGLSTILSFKGYALEVIKFAKEEPFLFEILLMKRKSPTILKEVIAAAGHEARIISAVESTFCSQHYFQMIKYHSGTP